MTAYKLLALDMDGTLLDSRKQVLPKTAAALEHLAATGVAVAFSTGRGLAELSDYVPNLPFIKYGSCISGGLVYDFSNQRTVFAHPFETKLALEVMALARQEAPMVHILTTTQSVAATEALPHMADFHMGIYQDMFDRICTPVDDMPAFARANEGAVCKVNLYHRSAESRERTRARLEEAGLAVQLACCPVEVAFQLRLGIDVRARVVHGVARFRGLGFQCYEFRHRSAPFGSVASTAS